MTNEFYEDADMAGPPQAPTPEDPMEAPPASGPGGQTSAKVPRAVLGDKPVQVGDTVTLQVAAVTDEEVELVAPEASSAEPETTPEMEEMMA